MLAWDPGNREMRLIVVLHGPFNSNSGIQVFQLANGLSRHGWEVAVAAPSAPEAIHDVGNPRFQCVTYEEAESVAGRWAGPGLAIHAWTPREGVRSLTERLSFVADAPYVVHLEDNEEHLLSTSTRRTSSRIGVLRRRRLSRLADDSRIHPAHYRSFVAGARALTMVTAELNRFNFARRPHVVVPPCVDTEQFAPGEPDPALRKELGLSGREFVIVYHGNTHSANRREIDALYRAVANLRRRGFAVNLIRLGQSFVGGERRGDSSHDGVIEVGVRPRDEVPDYLRLADAFVQPGVCDDFNVYRVPSKVPEFLATGRPVITPACNLGRMLADGENALLLNEGSADEIASRLERLIQDAELRERLGEGARAFALRRLTCQAIVSRLHAFLSQTIAQVPSGTSSR